MTFLFLSGGYVSLFLWSFLAATLVHVGSEWLLAALVIKSYNPLLLLFVASGGNVLGAMTTYAVGFFGGDRLTRNILRMKPETVEKAHGIFMKYGVWSLLFSWLPFIGDGLCLVGGALKVPMTVFFPLVFIGKCLRYLFIISLFHNNGLS
jgi:membrane protein YqaA with SNARE-associated domain